MFPFGEKYKLAREYRKAISKAPKGDDVVYFGGFEENITGENALLFSLYVPGKEGLVYLPYGALEDNIVAQLRDMQVGEAFKLLEEESVGGMGGNVIAMERITPPYIIRIEGQPTNFPDAPFARVLTL